jgi:hypothetical protein
LAASLAVIEGDVNRLLRGHGLRHMTRDMRHSPAADGAAAAMFEHRAGRDDGVTIDLERVPDGAVNAGGADAVAVADNHE